MNTAEPIAELSRRNRSARTSFLRWAGSKRKLLPELKTFWAEGYSRYVEPFAGSAALFFELRPALSLLSDMNALLIETFECVRDTPRSVSCALQALPLGRDAYYRLRSVNPKELIPVERAARFIFLNRFCFNGLYRTNDKGHFNVPFASSGTGNLPDEQKLLLISQALQTATLRCGDFEAILRTEVRRGDFVYLDPPYAVENRRIFRQYGPHTFGLQDLDRLSELLTDLDSRGAHFLLSYALCDEANQLFKHWNTKKLFVQRNIAGFAKHRRQEAELIATNIPYRRAIENESHARNSSLTFTL